MLEIIFFFFLASNLNQSNTTIGGSISTTQNYYSYNNIIRSQNTSGLVTSIIVNRNSSVDDDYVIGWVDILKSSNANNPIISSAFGMTNIIMKGLKLPTFSMFSLSDYNYGTPQNILGVGFSKFFTMSRKIYDKNSNRIKLNLYTSIYPFSLYRENNKISSSIILFPQAIYESKDLFISFELLSMINVILKSNRPVDTWQYWLYPRVQVGVSL